ncbi:hypothetical protein B0H12DRAFT_1076479 [Mycena haematopus]|nr:hypothetical protein B0H12DRAFT_1076479 [Mycena haematopus]
MKKDVMVARDKERAQSKHAFVLECKLELKDPTERGCAALASGLAEIVPSSQREETDYSRWHHTHTTSLYGHVLPSTSTYSFHRSLGLWHAFHVVWNTHSYPPWTATHLPYPASVYMRWETTVPLIVDPLLEEGEDKQHVSFSVKRPASPDTTFLRGVLVDSKSKGKGRA